MRTDATKVGQCILDLQGKLYDMQQENERLRAEVAVLQDKLVVATICKCASKEEEK